MIYILTDKYVKNFRLFKLYGCIDHYWFGHGDEFDLIKLIYGISQNDIYKEIVEENEKKLREALDTFKSTWQA